MADQDAGTESGAEPSESEWRFPLSAFEEDGADAEGSATSDRIEAGDPTLEGTVFLLLGIGFALFVISRLVVG